VFSVRIRADLKEKFTRIIKEKGYSTCSVVEPLLEAWLIAQNPPPHPMVDQGKTIVINQTFTKVVKRERRYGKSFEKNQWQDVDVLGEAHETNCYKNGLGWIYEKDQPINEVGHSVLCECSDCR